VDQWFETVLLIAYEYVLCLWCFVFFYVSRFVTMLYTAQSYERLFKSLSLQIVMYRRIILQDTHSNYW